jgi:hypothetical protein
MPIGRSVDVYYAIHIGNDRHAAAEFAQTIGQHQQCAFKRLACDAEFNGQVGPRGRALGHAASSFIFTSRGGNALRTSANSVRSRSTSARACAICERSSPCFWPT